MWSGLSKQDVGLVIRLGDLKGVARQRGRINEEECAIYYEETGYTAEDRSSYATRRIGSSILLHTGASR